MQPTLSDCGGRTGRPARGVPGSVFCGGNLNGRTCTWFQVVHPLPRQYFHFHLARIFVDDQLNLPVRYEAYVWPLEPDGQPLLLEEYSYTHLKLNNGFSDEDFSIENPAYHFR